MSDDNPRGMSLKTVAALSIALVCYLLWGGAAALYKAHIDHEANTIADQMEDGLAEDEGHDMHLRVRMGRGRGLVAAIVVMVAGLWMFISNSFVQLGHLPSLISYMFTQRMGYLIFCVCVLAVTGLGFLGMGRMQQSLESENPFSKGRPKKKLPKIRMPKPLDDD